MRLSSSQANPVYYEADYPDASMTSLLFTLVVPEGEAAPPYSPTTLTFYRTLYSPYTGVKTGINVTTDKIHLLTDAGGCL
ncbi:hypothetical protein SDC9_195999 [bioreactor metagenome]|uniref:Uncharacterized protein n=1 Tax=bioreactor metagenome TaxID=1076179 RepID=A0A645IC30_9ZZZZ